MALWNLRNKPRNTWASIQEHIVEMEAIAESVFDTMVKVKSAKHVIEQTLRESDQQIMDIKVWT